MPEPLPPPPVVFRPVCKNDIEALFNLVNSIRSGLPSLPKNIPALEKRIALSEQSFAKIVEKPGHENYLFILEDLSTNSIVGCSGIKALINGDAEHISYEVRKEKNSYDPLGINIENRALHPVQLHDLTEMVSLFLKREHRHPNHGKLLAFPRYIFLDDFNERFCHTLASDLRGYVDETGESPFWESFGKKLILEKASIRDIFEGRISPIVIQHLIPKHPIYLSLLSKEAVASIGKIHNSTIPAFQLLKELGFTETNFINIYDAGPILQCPKNDVKVIKERKKGLITKLLDDNFTQSPYITCNHGLNFRATLAYLEVYPNQTLGIPKNIAEILQVKENDTISYYNLLPS